MRRRQRGYRARAPVSSNNLATLQDAPASEIIVLDDPVELEDTTLALEKIPSTSLGKMEKSISFREPAELVTIITSTPPNQQEFKLPKNVVSHYSPFFETAFKSQFIEGQTQSMTLEDVEGEVFGCMVHWFYTQKIETQSGGTDADDLPKLVKLWILAERCIVPRLQNAALEYIYKYNLYLNNICTSFSTGDTVPDTLRQVIDVIFNSAEQHDILRKLIVDFYTAQSFKILETLIPHMPQALVVGAFLQISKDRDAGKFNHQIPKIEEYLVEIPGETKIQTTIEEEKCVAPSHPSTSTHLFNSQRRPRVGRPVGRIVAVHGRPATNRVIRLNCVPSKRS